MGVIHVSPDGDFIMQTPGGPRRVTLRCTVDGHVMVEDVAGGGVSLQAVKITMHAEKNDEQTPEVISPRLRRPITTAPGARPTSAPTSEKEA